MAGIPNILYARIKPYNPKKRHLRVRTVVDGSLFQGGDGINQIPAWYRVDRQLAERLMRMRQIDGDPDSPRVFDIVTEERRRHIDQIEEGIRKSVLGIGVPISSIPDGRAPTRDLSIGDLTEPQPTLDQIVRGDDTSVLSAPDLSVPTPNLSADVIDVAGRAAAAEGLEMVAAPPPAPPAPVAPPPPVAKPLKAAPRAPKAAKAKAAKATRAAKAKKASKKSSSRK